MENFGMLYLCATPIGNLQDISYRFVEVFNYVDIIAAEDTRRTVKILNHLEIAKPLTSYHEHNKREKGDYLIGQMKEGKNVALVSDAGTPAISDPGEDLVRLCIENNINITSIPGPVACINALVLSGINTTRFAFEGFLSVNKRHRYNHLESLQYDPHTLIFYEAPHKLLTTLNDMLKILGDRRISIVRELTKIHEEVIRTTISEAINIFNEKSPRGEFVLVIEGTSKIAEEKIEQWWNNLDIIQHVNHYIDEGMSAKDAIKKTADDRSMKKREVYATFHSTDE